MKVTKATGSNSKTVSTIDLFGDVSLDSDTKDQIRKDVGDFLIEKITEYASVQESPISGGKWKASLSKDYAKKKEELIGNSDANLELTGDMLSALTWDETKNGIMIGLIGEQAGKADGHNNFSGESKIPTRQFLPDVGDEFKFQDDIDKIIAEAIADNIPKEAFKGINSKSDLYDVLKEYFDGYTNAEIKSTILRTPDLFSELDELGLLDLL